MKILLMGEFSGFYLNLKQGLQELGAEVTLAANGDGWKLFCRSGSFMGMMWCSLSMRIFSGPISTAI